MKFGAVPPEPPRITSLDALAPKVARAVSRVQLRMAVKGQPTIIGESIRTAQRQRWLWGFGREYDDGRGIVTNVKTIWTGWHPFGLAVDFWHKRDLWRAPASFWQLLAEQCEAEGLFAFAKDDGIMDGDKPHAQWAACRVTPSWRTRVLYESGGMPAVWKAVGAA